jgi:glycine/D-amino acid oxidase-like deaminating enzyme
MFDVLIIGGGMVGACCAYECATHGLRTALLERQDLASGASGRAGGLLLKGATDVFAPQIVPHLLANQQLLEHFLQNTGAHVEYVRGGSLYIAFEEDWAFTQDKVQQMCSAGLAAELWDAVQLRSALPMLTREAVGGRFIASDAQLSPPQLALAFAQAARQAGAELRTHVAVHSFVRDKHGVIAGVQTRDETISARSVILATNAYTGRLWPLLESVVTPTRGQALLTAPLPQSFPFACAANYDLEYWRQTRSGQILFGGCRRLEVGNAFGKGTDSTETTPEVQDGLKEALLSLFPEWRGAIKFERSWAGTMGFTHDYKPLIGRLPGHENILIGAGFSGNGLPLVCITASLLRELIVQGSTSLSLSTFDPSRFLSKECSESD